MSQNDSTIDRVLLWMVSGLAGEKHLRELVADRFSPGQAGKLALRLVRRSLSEAGSLGEGGAIILLCGCTDVNQCHRKLLADWLAQAWSADVVHLTPPDKNAQPGQQKLF